jgi:hypothetical protein
MIDIRAGVVFGHRCPFMDDVADVVQPVFMIVRARKQSEGGAPPPLHTLKLAEVAILLLCLHALPLIAAKSDVKWVAIT